MKRMLTILVVVLLLGLSSYGLAQETEETRTSVTVGLKMWYATWEETVAGETMESDPGLMYGPAINLRHGNFFAGLSYLTGSFTFEDSWTETYYLGGGYYDYLEFDYEVDADRTDMDLSIGYYVHPNVGLFLGYKTIEFEIKAAATVTETIYNYYTYVYEYTGTASDKADFSGPALGVTMHYPIGRTILFGTLSYVSLEGELYGISEELTGPAIEFGVAYALEASPVSFAVGYKYQKYEYGEAEAEDVFSGFTIGVNYTF